MHLGKNKRFAYNMLDADLNRGTLTEPYLERDLDLLVSNILSWEYQINAAVSKARHILKNWINPPLSLLISKVVSPRFDKHNIILTHS